MNFDELANGLEDLSLDRLEELYSVIGAEISSRYAEGMRVRT